MKYLSVTLSFYCSTLNVQAGDLTQDVECNKSQGCQVEQFTMSEILSSYTDNQASCNH